MTERTVKLITASEMNQGDVVRMIREDDKIYFGDAFLDHTVLDAVGETIKLARPYAHVSNSGTMCPSILTGVEQYSISRNGTQKWLLVSDHYIAGTFTFEDLEKAKAEAIAAVSATK